MSILSPFRRLAARLWRPDKPLLPTPAKPRRWSVFWRYAQVPLAVGVAALGAQEYAGVRDDWVVRVRAGFTMTEGSGSLVVGLITALPILLIARRSLLAWTVSVLAGYLFGAVSPMAAKGFGTWPWNPVEPLMLIAVLFVVGLRHRIPVLVAVWFGTMLMITSTVRLNQAGVAVLCTVPIIIGGIIGRNFKLGQKLAAETERGGVLTERARIARELHDVVAHHMSMIAVRAETAPYRLADVGQETRTEFGEISAAARQALTEMRLLLGVLRSDETTPPPTAPQPRLADLPDLVASARHAGAEVRLHTGEDADLPDDVPQIVEVSAYRIVQEALSNVARHAPGAAADVEVRVEGDVLRVRVANGPGTRPSAGGGSGYGLKGAAERAAILGGSLEAGPDGEGGYVVEARLPLGSGEG